MSRSTLVSALSKVHLCSRSSRPIFINCIYSTHVVYGRSMELGELEPRGSKSLQLWALYFYKELGMIARSQGGVYRTI